MGHSAGICEVHGLMRLRWLSTKGPARLTLLTIVVACLMKSYWSLHDATAVNFLEALARSQLSLPGSTAEHGSTQTVLPCANERHLQPQGHSSLTVLRCSAKLTGASALAEKPDQESGKGGLQQRVVVDFRDAPQGFLLLHSGLELVLEHLTLVFCTSEPTQIVLGLGDKGEVANGNADSNYIKPPVHLAAGILARQLLHPASRGTLVLNNVVLELARCTATADSDAETQAQVLPESSRPAADFRAEKKLLQEKKNEDASDDPSRHPLLLLRESEAAAAITADGGASEEAEQQRQLTGPSTSTLAAVLEKAFHWASHHRLLPMSGHVVTEGGAVLVHRHIRVRYAASDSAAAMGAVEHGADGEEVTAAVAAAAAASPDRRQLLAAVGQLLRHDGRTPARGPLSGLQGIVIVTVVVVAVVAVVWLRRLLSCACFAPSGDLKTPAVELMRSQNGNPSVHKSAMSLAGSSQNHTLSALSRFSAQLRKGDDPSVREGSIRRGSILSRLATDASVRGGAGGGGGEGPDASRLQPGKAPELPALIKDLCDLKFVGQGRLATILQGTWQQQQERVMVKVLTHGEDCCFMLEQVGDVWTRLTHANIVNCFAAETFPASDLASLPAATAQLIPKPSNADSTLQTWLVLERCENGSLAAVLAQRYQQQQAARRTMVAVTANESDGGKEAAATARQVARRLAPFSKGRPKSSKDGSTSPATPPQNNQSLAEPSALSLSAPAPVLEDPSPPALPSPSPPPMALPSPKLPQTGENVMAEVSEPSSGASGTAVAAEESFCGGGGGGGGGSGNCGGGDLAAPLPGLLPVAEVLSIAYDVASGLAYLHSLDLCHGDLRAENVMMQTVVLPSTARAPGTESTTGDLVPAAAAAATTDGAAAMGIAGMPCGDGHPGVSLVAGEVVSAAAAALGSCHTVDEGLAVMYGSTGGRSDTNDAPGGGAGGGVSSGVGVNYQRPIISNMSSYVNATNVSCAGVQDSSAHAWSNSLRHSNGFMTGSTYASTATQSLAVAGAGPGGGGGGGGGARCLEPGSVDDRLGPSSLQSQGLGSTIGNCYFSTNGGPVGQPCALNGYKSSIGGSTSAAARFGSLVTASAVTGANAAAEVSTVGRSGAPDGAGLASPALATSAVGALSRAIRVHANSSQPYQPSRVAGSITAGGVAPFSRRQSNGSLSATNTNSGNDVAMMSKALSGLTAWPESPHEGRHVSGPASDAAAKEATSLAATSGSNGGASGCAVTFSRTASSAGAGGGGGGMPSPPRRAPLIGGLKSALTAPDPAKASASVPPSASAIAVATSTPQPRPLTTNLSAEGSPFRSPLSQGPLPDDDPLISPLAAAQLPSEPSGQEADGAASSSMLSPRVIALQVNGASGSSGPPSPCGRACTAGPSTPTGGGGGGGGGGSGPGPTAIGATGPPGRSRSSVGVVCSIAGHQARRSSAPSVVALPVIRRIAKLTDPWLSLARMPPECAGGPWRPEAADAVGATSGADVSHLPPELLLSGRLHPSSDVYSLGMLLWRMLSTTGEAPYGKLRPAEVAYKVAACGMRPSFSPAIPDPLRRLVEDCWQSDPAARPTVQQVMQRLSDLQACATTLQNQWRERHALFGAVSTVPISAVAILPLRGDQNEITARWAEAAGIKLLRTSTSWASGGSAAATAAAVGRGELSTHASFGGRSSRAQSGTFKTLASYVSIGASGSAAHLYQQPLPPTPPAGPITNVTTMHFALATMVSNNYSNITSDGNTRGSQSNHRSTSPYTGHLSVQPYMRGLEQF